ncbi:MAG: hypothetical protein HY321_04920 [Armatimonadetes bacterium]|nr:hypothetical protein [Armatimonadota bacterium]
MGIEVTREEASARLGELIQRTLEGDECTILVDGEPLISLVPTPRWRGLLELEDEIAGDLDSDPDTIAAVQRGLEQAESGNTVPDSQVSAVLRKRAHARGQLVG